MAFLEDAKLHNINVFLKKKPEPQPVIPPNDHPHHISKQEIETILKNFASEDIHLFKQLDSFTQKYKVDKNSSFIQLYKDITSTYWWSSSASRINPYSYKLNDLYLKMIQKPEESTVYTYPLLSLKRILETIDFTRPEKDWGKIGLGQMRTYHINGAKAKGLFVNKEHYISVPHIYLSGKTKAKLLRFCLSTMEHTFRFLKDAESKLAKGYKLTSVDLRYADFAYNIVDIIGHQMLRLPMETVDRLKNLSSTDEFPLQIRDFRYTYKTEFQKNIQLKKEQQDTLFVPPEKKSKKPPRP